MPVDSTFVLSRSAARRLGVARDWLAARDRERGALVLASSRGASDDLVLGHARQHGALWDIHRLTPLALAGELAAALLSESHRSPASPLAREALAARAARHVTEAGELTSFAAIADFPGFPRAVSRTLSELRSAAVAPRSLRSGDASARDLGRLLTAYQEELDRWSLADAGDVFHLATTVLDRGVAHHLLDRDLLLLDLAIDSALEQRFLASLARRSTTILALGMVGDDRGNKGLASALGCAAEDLDRQGDHATRLGRLRSSIFARDEPAEKPSDDAATDDDSLIFLSAPGEGREAVELARRVRDQAAAGTPFDRVAILLRDPRRYLPAVEEAFARARIPIYLSRGTRRPHAAGRAFLALLACAGEDLSASRFAEYLSLGEVPEPDPLGAPPMAEVPWVEADSDQLVLSSPPTSSETEHPPGSIPAPRRWERLLVDAAVVGGQDRWARRLDGLAEEIRLQIDELRAEPAAAAAALRLRLEQLERLRHFALPLIEQLAALPERAAWGAWLDHLERLASRALRHAEPVLRVLAELRTLSEVGPVAIDDVRRTLDERLRFLLTDPPRHRWGRVFVGTPEDARGRSFAVVLVPGLAEGIFPRRASEDPLLLDPARRRLDPGLVTQDERFGRERLRLRLAIGAAESRLIVSYPSVDAEVGRARVPSFYALDIQRAADGSLPDLARLEASATEAAGAVLGWPAPADPARAIDEAEFDLAHLEPLLGQQDDKLRGAGRYLIDANEHLARALRRRWRRWHERLGEADGLVDVDDATRATLAAHRLGERSYSPTALQQFAACPYRFLLYAVHRLHRRDETSALEQLDPLTRGSLFHEVQFRLLSRLRESDRLPVVSDDLEAVRVLADEALTEVAAEFEERLAPAVPQVWRSEIEGLRIDLHGWLHNVVEHDERFRPAHFELAFGLPADDDHDPASRTDAVPIHGGAHLRGSIDLVEIDDEADAVRVTDHKTGLPWAKTNVQVGGGEVLQPLLYGLAAQDLLDRPVTAGQLFYCTRRGSYERRSVNLDDEGRQAVAHVLTTIDHALAQGFLPAAPKERACTYCDYRPICGPEEERRILVKIGTPGKRISTTQATSQQRLAALFALREMR